MPPIFWPLVILAAVVLVVFYLRKRGAKELSVPAKVVDKCVENHRRNGKDDDSLPSDYLVSFQTEKRSLRLLVNRSTYDRAQPGLEGTLFYKGDVFIHFEPLDSRSIR